MRIRFLFIVLSLCASPLVKAAAISDVCESALAERIVVWYAPSRAKDLSPSDFEQARIFIENLNLEIFSDLRKPRVFEVTKKAPEIVGDYTRVVFRTVLGFEVLRAQQWSKDSEHRDWIGFLQLRALLMRQEILSREIAVLDEFLQSPTFSPRQGSYERWRQDLQNEMELVVSKIQETESWMETALPENEVLSSLQQFLVDFVKVMAADDDRKMRSETIRFTKKRDEYRWSRRLLGKTFLNAISQESPRSVYTYLVMRAVVETSADALDERTSQDYSNLLYNSLWFHLLQYEQTGQLPE